MLVEEGQARERQHILHFAAFVFLLQLSLAPPGVHYLESAYKDLQVVPSHTHKVYLILFALTQLPPGGTAETIISKANFENSSTWSKVN